ncbi:hypothetical protein DPMN_101870 [Dreissena polymorpha]|uniref:Uncharacterized protein n=1 Tax=Dreissena polymorpha TaxID=45954 RepID=A0A9D4R8M9_DREPO|nr:hypothetical protein DPMN_101870 [Dreissena polymorpha]
MLSRISRSQEKERPRNPLPACIKTHELTYELKRYRLDIIKQAEVSVQDSEKDKQTPGTRSGDWNANVWPDDYQDCSGIVERLKAETS